MAKTAEQVLQGVVGGFVLQIAQLQAQLGATNEALAAAQAEIQVLNVRIAEGIKAE